MYDLIDFLVEERYCNSELEALKIIESISDEFYRYLVEEVSASQRVRAMRGRMGNLISSLMKDPTNTTLQRQIKTIRSAIPQQEKISRGERAIQSVQGSKGIASTPRGPGGSRFQKPRDVVSSTGSLPGVKKASDYILNKKAEKLSGGMPSGSQSSRSVRSPQTAEITGGIHGTVHGGRGTQRDRTTGGIVGVKRP